jgi:hypothetical protein
MNVKQQGATFLEADILSDTCERNIAVCSKSQGGGACGAQDSKIGVSKGVI